MKRQQRGSCNYFFSWGGIHVLEAEQKLAMPITLGAAIARTILPATC